MRYWLDTEFIEDGSTIDLLSIGVVAEDGRVLYLQNADVDYSKASAWVREHVFPHVVPCQCVTRWGNYAAEHLPTCEWQSRLEISKRLFQFCHPPTYGTPEFWGWCSAYDWVAVCQLYGTMMDKPEDWPSYIRDLQQELDRHGISDATLYKAVPNNAQVHHALADAQYIRSAYNAITHIGQINVEQP